MIPEVKMYRLIMAFSGLLSARLDAIEVAPKVDQVKLDDAFEVAKQIAEKLEQSQVPEHSVHGRMMWRVLNGS